jgi:hypothetical protein
VAGRAAHARSFGVTKAIRRPPPSLNSAHAPVELDDGQRPGRELRPHALEVLAAAREVEGEVLDAGVVPDHGDAFGVLGDPAEAIEELHVGRAVQPVLDRHLGVPERAAHVFERLGGPQRR